jgi:hypothetical protein
MIYFIQSGLRVKIGYAADPWKRLKDLQTGSAETLHLAAVLEGERDYEQFLHQHFAPYRLHGEWFAASVEMDEFVASNKRNRLDLIPHIAKWASTHLQRYAGGKEDWIDLFNAFRVHVGEDIPVRAFGQALRHLCQTQGMRFGAEQSRAYCYDVCLNTTPSMRRDWLWPGEEPLAA